MKTKPLTNHPSRPRRFCALPLGIALLLTLNSSAVEAAGTEETDKQLCPQQLQQIFQAVQAYRRDHKDLPDWRTDLVPQYIADTNLLICPITKRTGQTHTFEHLKDPKLPTAVLVVPKLHRAEVNSAVQPASSKQAPGFRPLNKFHTSLTGFRREFRTTS